jgi:hypothetical protein
MNSVAEITPSHILEAIDECSRRLDAIEAIATALSIANAAGSLNDATVFQPKLAANVLDGIALLAIDASRALHGTA